MTSFLCILVAVIILVIGFPLSSWLADKAGIPDYGSNPNQKTGWTILYILALLPTVLAFGFLALGALVVILSGPVRGRDFGQWDRSDPIVQWYQSLMQPDIPTASCCGEADAYWAGSFAVSKDGEYVAIITDPRPDEPLRRKHVPIGTRIVVPNYKLKYDQSNPTGHGVIFLSRGDYVYCYVAPGGV